MLPTNQAEHETLEITQGINDWAEVAQRSATAIFSGARHRFRSGVGVQLRSGRRRSPFHGSHHREMHPRTMILPAPAKDREAESGSTLRRNGAFGALSQPVPARTMLEALVATVVEDTAPNSTADTVPRKNKSHTRGKTRSPEPRSARLNTKKRPAKCIPLLQQE